MEKKSWFTYLLFFLIGFVFFSILDYFYPNFYHKNATEITPLRESNLSQNDKYKFIDPLIGINRPSDYTSDEYKDLRNKIDKVIAGQGKNINLSSVSVYFRDEKTGGGFTINPNEKYGMASLIKVPIMISYFKLAQKNPSILDKEIYYYGNFDNNAVKNIKSENVIKPNKFYKVSELIDYMVKYSDNNAYTLLANNLNITDTYVYANDLFNDLGIDDISIDKDNMDVNSYSLFFRVLYNSTYLSRNYSELALEILSDSDYTRGIRAGVPKNVPVSQKFGEAVIKNTNGFVIGKEFHNCGIIYHQTRPYLLCVMTKGKDLEFLQNFVEEISKASYEYVSRIR